MDTGRIRMARTMGSTTLNSGRVIASVLSIVVGLALSFFGALKLLVEPNRAALVKTAEAIQDGQRLDPALQELTRTELRRARDGSLVGLAGLIAVSQAQSAGFDTADGRVWLNRGIADLRRGLSRSPGDGMAWMRLAGAIYLRDGPSPEAGAAMRVATYLVKPNAWTSPLYFQLTAALWSRLTSDVQDQVRQKYAAAWKTPGGRSYLQELVAFPAGLATLREIFAGDPGLEGWIAEQMKALASERERQALH